MELFSIRIQRTFQLVSTTNAETARKTDTRSLRIHSQELEAKDREISWLNSLYLKKRINGFLMFKEQFDKLRHSLRRPTEEPSKSREFKL